ncbi:MAG: hypothetical protein J6R12_08195 [Bacteroidales bacterium]|nr:hypothetical protein [Bacteroidales bacterium]
MQKIKTVQPYKLYAKLVEAKPSVRKTFRNTIIAAFIFVIPVSVIDPICLIVVPISISLLLPLVFYDFKLTQFYIPKKSYLSIREVAQGKTPSFLYHTLFVTLIIIGLIIDVIMGVFPLFILLCGVLAYLSIIYLKKYKSKQANDRLTQIQLQNHRDIDYNAKIDLNSIYNVNDKLILSYQNFKFTQKKLYDGNFILGVSPLGIYFAHKKNTIEKLFVKYEEINTVGLLQGVSNVFIFNIRTIHNNEINIIIDRLESLVVSPIMIMNKMLTSIDEFLLNGSVASTTAERRRRVVTTPSTVIATTPRVESSTSGRAIDMDTTTETINEPSDNTNRRVIDIEFTPEVVAELAQGSFIEANRSIDIF